VSAANIISFERLSDTPEHAIEKWGRRNGPGGRHIDLHRYQQTIATKQTGLGAQNCGRVGQVHQHQSTDHRVKRTAGPRFASVGLEKLHVVDMP
jgi:hypothetical protein